MPEMTHVSDFRDITFKRWTMIHDWGSPKPSPWDTALDADDSKPHATLTWIDTSGPKVQKTNVSMRNGSQCRALQVVMEFMILFLDSVCVGRFAKKNRSESFVRSFSRVSVSGESNHGVSQTQLLPRSHSQTIV